MCEQQNPWLWVGRSSASSCRTYSWKIGSISVQTAERAVTDTTRGCSICGRMSDLRQLHLILKLKTFLWVSITLFDIRIIIYYVSNIFILPVTSRKMVRATFFIVWRESSEVHCQEQSLIKSIMILRIVGIFEILRIPMMLRVFRISKSYRDKYFKIFKSLRFRQLSNWNSPYFLSLLIFSKF